MYQKNRYLIKALVPDRHGLLLGQVTFSEQWLPRRQSSSVAENVFTVVCLFLSAMKLLRRRKTILVILVAIWIGGMVYFLIPLRETKDESLQAVDIDNFLQGDELGGERKFRDRVNNEHNRNLNDGTYEDNVSKSGSLNNESLSRNMKYQERIETANWCR